MTLYLDSALVDDAAQAFALGCVGGITTNPALIAKSGRPPGEVVAALCDVSEGTVFYQLSGLTLESRRAEAWAVQRLRPGRVGLKIAATPDNLGLAAELAQAGAVVGITGLFTAAQVYLACQVGARYVLPYVNRSTRLLGDGVAMVRRMRVAIDAAGTCTEIIAASVKSPAEAIDTLIAGSHHITLPLDVILAMGQHELSDAAIAEFAKATRGE